MRSPRVLVYERDGRLYGLLRTSVQTAGLFRFKESKKEEPTTSPGPHNWSLRQPRQVESCLRLLKGGGPSILVVRAATRAEPGQTPEELESEQRRQERALRLVERVHWLRPETDVVVVSDQADDALAGLAWDLGAAYVLFPPQPLSALPGIVAQLMHSAIKKN
jgi:hypothetical protein